MRQSKSLGSLATWPSRTGRSNSSKSNLADVAEADRMWPTSADAYELLDECGKGVSAEVYRARCLVNDRIVGIKALNLEWLMTPLDEVMHEAQIMKAYKHDSILPLYCSFVTGQELWMVMPYMEGGSVAHILRYKYPEGLSEVVIATIMRKVLEALAYVHKQGDIHRDVKAGNVLVDGEGNVKLGDFGVAATPEREEDWRGPKTRNTFVGTPCWMAPEVLEQVSGYGTSADIWSFGITILEMAHGHAPFSKLPPMKVLLMTLQGPPPQLEASCGSRHFSRGMREVVARCLNKDPKKRPTAKELLEHKFFKQAKDAEFLRRALLADLPPLPQRCNEIRAGKAATMARENERAAMASHISYVTDIAQWDFNCCKGLLEAAAAPAAAPAAAAGGLPAAGLDSQPSSRPSSGRDQYQQQQQLEQQQDAQATGASAAVGSHPSDVVSSAAGLDQQQRQVSEDIGAGVKDTADGVVSNSSSGQPVSAFAAAAAAAGPPADAAAAAAVPPVSPRLAYCFSGGKQVAAFPVSNPSTPDHSPRSSRPTSPDCFGAAAAAGGSAVVPSSVASLQSPDSRPGTAGSGMSAKRHGRFMIIEGSAPYQGPEIADHHSVNVCRISSSGSSAAGSAAAVGGKAMGQLSPLARQRSISTPDISRLSVLRLDGFENTSPRAAAAAAEPPSGSPRAAAVAATSVSPRAAAAAEASTSPRAAAAAVSSTSPRAAAAAASSGSKSASPAANANPGVLSWLIPQSLKDRHAESPRYQQQQQPVSPQQRAGEMFPHQQQLNRPLSCRSRDASPSGDFSFAAAASVSPRAAANTSSSSSMAAAAAGSGAALCSLARPGSALTDIYPDTSAAGDSVSSPRELHTSSGGGSNLAKRQQQQQYSSAANCSLARPGAALADVYPTAAGSSSTQHHHTHHTAADVWDHLKEVCSEAVAHVTQPFKSAAASHSQSLSPPHQRPDIHHQQQVPQRSSSSGESLGASSMVSASSARSSMNGSSVSGSCSKPPRYQAAAAGSARHQQQQQQGVAAADAGVAAAAAGGKPAAKMVSFADTVDRNADKVLALLTGSQMLPVADAAAAAAAAEHEKPDTATAAAAAESAAAAAPQQQQQQRESSASAVSKDHLASAAEQLEQCPAAAEQPCQQELCFSDQLHTIQQQLADTAAPTAVAGTADAPAAARKSQQLQDQTAQPDLAAAAAAAAAVPKDNVAAALTPLPSATAAEVAAAPAAAAEAPVSPFKVAVALMPQTPVKQQQPVAAGRADITPVRRQRGRFTIIES